MKKTFAVHWQYGAATHTGWFRTINEDRYLLRMGTSADGTLYAAAGIADGMGGTDEGALASENAIEMLKIWLEMRLPVLLSSKNRLDVVENECTSLFHSIHRHLRELGEQKSSTLGTTLTLLLIYDSVYTIVHIGDCRVYKMSQIGGWKRLTHDHTWVSEQVRWGKMSAKRARRHPKRNILTQWLGMKELPQCDVRSGYCAPQTLFMLSSDGFHGMFSDGAIAYLLRKWSREQEDLQDICDRFLTRALEKRVDDNISLLLLKPLSRAIPLKSYWILHAKLVFHKMKKMSALIPVGPRK